MTCRHSLQVSTTDGTWIEIPDPQRFCDHLEAFHRSGVSIHTERGYSFRIDDSFRACVQEQISRIKPFR